MDGKNDLIVQSSISMIFKTEDICLKYPQNMPKKIPEIYLEHPQNLSGTSLKSVSNILGMAKKSPSPQCTPQQFG
jgi:hypothetical protein